MKRLSSITLFTRKLYIYTIGLIVLSFSSPCAQPQFEFCNNFLQNLSFVTGTNRGIEQNLDDNFGWMQQQGYTHLRYFGIYANAYHTFPSPTLDANGYPSNPALETVLSILVDKANEYGITINFDGWEVIAESNQDTLQSGFGYLTEVEVAAVVQEVLDLGVTMITEEQFGGSYLQAIQLVVAQAGGIHETTAGIWWPHDIYADEQLGNVFSYYFYDQAEIDSRGPYHPATISNLHIYAEGAHYHGIPFSIAVGSFGLLEAENWKNVLLFAYIQHTPERFSIEEENTTFTIWNHDFNFQDDIGDELLAFTGHTFGERPVVNLVYDAATLFSESFYPTVNASRVTNPAIINTFTQLGYRVIPTVDSIMTDVDCYYLLLAGGLDAAYVAPLPDYVLPLLAGGATVFLQPCAGIPDENDAADWLPVREQFGLPAGDTESLIDAVPENVMYNGYPVKWSGAALWINPILEDLPAADIDTTEAAVVLTGEVNDDEIALIIKNGNTFLVNSNVIHLEASYILSNAMDGPLRKPAMADVAVTDSQALIFAEYATDIDMALPWAGLTHIVRYDPQGTKILDTDSLLGNGFTATLQRGELVILLDDPATECWDGDGDGYGDPAHPENTCLEDNCPDKYNPGQENYDGDEFGNACDPCDCTYHGDVDGNLIINPVDVIIAVNFVYRGYDSRLTLSTTCPAPPGDWNCDGFVNPVDVVYYVNYVYKSNGQVLCNPCSE